MLIVRAVLGAVLLFLGRELNFLFAGGMAALLAIELTPLLPPEWPVWSDTASILGLGVLAGLVPAINERAGYFLSGLLAGGYYLSEYYAPGVLFIPLLPFVVGGVIGALIMGIFTEWALMVVSCLVGALYITDLFRLSPTAETLIQAALFIVGALTQVILMRMQKQSDR
jgi:hypothetical protein